MRLLSVETFKLGLHNLRLHKLRSFLTSLGIIFGVAAVICMLSISEGASADELRMLELLGTKNIIINSVKPPQTREVAQGNTNLIEYGITATDMDIIRATVPHVDAVVPMKTVSYRVRRGERQSAANVVGTTPTIFDTINISVNRGRPLVAEDMVNAKNVCVVGADIARELFPFSDPIGEVILADQFPSAVPFTVVGILNTVLTAGTPARGVEERNLNWEILVPLTTARAQFSDMTRRVGSGSREFIKMQFSGLYVTADQIEHVVPVSRMVQRVFENGHKDLDYEIKVPLERLEQAKRKKRNNQIVLGFIAGISLLVGGIGIMNIMLATVTERTREIGVRRALGAKQRDITIQFLVETVVLSTGGGLLGVGLGVGGSHIVSGIAGWQTIVSGWSVAVSFSLSVLVGILFGMYPAMAAARLDPIEALRHE